MSDYLNISLKLHKEKDRELVDFLDKKPKTWIIKEALKMYMNVQSQVTPTGQKDDRGAETKNDASALLGQFNIKQ